MAINSEWHKGVDELWEEIDDLKRQLAATEMNVETGFQEISSLKAQLAAAKYSPIGDNHHNAALCPYCGEPLRKAIAENADLKQQLAESHFLIDELNHTICDAQATYQDLTQQLAAAREREDDLQVRLGRLRVACDVVRELLSLGVHEGSSVLVGVAMKDLESALQQTESEASDARH